MNFLEKRLETIRQVYLSDERPWVVAFSGGKDSTAVLQLTWWSLAKLKGRRRQKPVHVCYVDTGMEHPVFANLVRSTLRKVSRATRANRMPFRVHLLRPEIKHRYFVSVIGRGYAPPTHWFRWCTTGLRIRPMAQFIKREVSASGEVVIVLGLRNDESVARRATLARFSTGHPFVGRYSSYKSTTAFTPIEDFRAEDVWQMLTQARSPWKTRNRDLAHVYRSAGGGDCLTYSIKNGVGPSCGGSRFGCWTCTVVRRDKTGESLADENDRYRVLVDFRNWLATLRYERSLRWKRRRNGDPGPGPLRLSARRQILYRLLEIQDEAGLSLIEDDEIAEIQRLWMMDGDRNNSALKLVAESRERVRSQVVVTT